MGLPKRKRITKMIDGQKYEFVSLKGRKTDAKDIAENMRKLGYKARVLYDGKYYRVWRRR